MSKSEETKAKIVEQAATLFNRQGYAGSSMSDIMSATGLKKGGIYNHFESKDALAIAAFEFAVRRAKSYHLQTLRESKHSLDRLKAMARSFVANFDAISAAGGCPLLNTAIESDDTHPALRQRTQQAMDDWRQLIRRIVDRGIQQGEISSSVDSDVVATTLIANLEGSLMLAKLYGNTIYLHRAEDHLTAYIEGLR